MEKTTRYNFVSELAKAAKETAQGSSKLTQAEWKTLIEAVILNGVKRAARGERVRFPVIGALTRKAVKERTGGVGKNPFTGGEMVIKPRAASQKPRWSFPKALKETFADSQNW